FGDRGAGRADQGTEDPHSQVQEQDRLPQAPGSPSAADGPEGHRHQVSTGQQASPRRHCYGTQEGRVQLPERTRFQRPAARRQALRRPDRQGRRDPGPPAWHPLRPRRERRPRWRRHPVRPGGGRGGVRHQAGPQDREHRCPGAGSGLTAEPIRTRAERVRVPTLTRFSRFRAGFDHAVRLIPPSCNPGCERRHVRRPASKEDDSTMSKFIDRVVLHVRAGKGGHGCASVHREKFKPLGGPDGGNGGNGGDVVFEVDPNVHTLLDFHFHPHAKAGNGKPGEGGNRDGKSGADLVLKVPDGTVVLDKDGEVLIDLVGAGNRFVAARGGRGGLGNAALASKARKAPGFALLGEEGEEHDLVLELKSVADVGLVGFPSAGKSSLVSVLSAAKPKIADYPFTTLVPNLGVVASGDTTFTVADVPGLIPGASEGRSLGLDFLRHLERCAVLAHVVDCAALEPGRDPTSDVDALEAELAAYKPALSADAGLGHLADLPRVVILNKTDVPDGAELAEMVTPEFTERGWPVFQISAFSRAGLRPLTFA